MSEPYQYILVLAYLAEVRLYERMLASKRGREYARQIPLDRLLLETDAPAEANTETSAQSLIKSLTRTSMRIVSLKNCDAKRIESAVLTNAHSVFDLR